MTYRDPKANTVVDTVHEFITDFGITYSEFVETHGGDLADLIVDTHNDGLTTESQTIDTIEPLTEDQIAEYIDSLLAGNSEPAIETYLDGTEGEYTSIRTPGGHQRIIAL